jgi:hypothetical protein
MVLKMSPPDKYLYQNYEMFILEVCIYILLLANNTKKFKSDSKGKCIQESKYSDYMHCIRLSRVTEPI